MLKKGNSPYWKRSQYDALTKGTWDIVTIMLGTNDAKDPGDHGPDNWQHDCGGASHTKLDGCSFAADYKDMIDVVKTLGRTPAGPKIYLAIPPPLMAQYSIGANQTVINSARREPNLCTTRAHAPSVAAHHALLLQVYPKLVPLISAASPTPKTTGKVIDIYTEMGGVADWAAKFPAKCEIGSPWAPCAWWCDKQSCDQCHPNDDGYAHLAQGMLKGLGL